MIIKRVVSDILFWLFANVVVIAAAKDVNGLLSDRRGLLLFAVLNILWLVPIIGDVYVPPQEIKTCEKEYLHYLTMGLLLLEFGTVAYEYTHFGRTNKIALSETISALITIGLGFLISSVAWLSIKRYSATRFQTIKGHKVIRSGLYSVIRHPIWLSFFLIAGGLAVLFRSALGMTVLIVVVAPLWIYVIKEEEDFLVSKLGNDYVTYARQTKKLIPFIY